MRRVIVRIIKFSFLVRLKAPLQFSLSDIHLPSYRYICEYLWKDSYLHEYNFKRGRSCRSCILWQVSKGQGLERSRHLTNIFDALIQINIIDIKHQRRSMRFKISEMRLREWLARFTELTWLERLASFPGFTRLARLSGSTRLSEILVYQVLQDFRKFQAIESYKRLSAVSGHRVCKTLETFSLR